MERLALGTEGSMVSACHGIDIQVCLTVVLILYFPLFQVLCCFYSSIKVNFFMLCNSLININLFKTENKLNEF